MLRVTVPAVLKGQFRRRMKSDTGANRHGVTVSHSPVASPLSLLVRLQVCCFGTGTLQLG